MNKEEFDIIVVGAGIAGSAISYALGKAGKHVLCLERDLSEPDRIVGELMQPGGVKLMEDLGLGECFQDIDASPAYGYGIFKGAQGTKLSYPKTPQSSPMPVNGFSFHHGKFVQKLRAKAMTVPTVELRQATVKSLYEGDDTDSNQSQAVDNNNQHQIDINQQEKKVKGVRYIIQHQDSGDNDKAERIAIAPLTIICDGCFSALRKTVIPTNVPSQTSTFVGMILRNCQLPYPDHGHVFLVDPSPILMYRIGSNEIRVLVDVPDQVCPSNNELRQRFREMTAPQLPEPLRTSFLEALETEQLKKMPNSRLHPITSSKPGSIIIGDAWNMRHPLTGAGMTVALSDVKILSQLLAPLDKQQLENQSVIDNVMLQFTIRRKPLASTLNVLAGALYKVFSASNEHLRKACLDYLSLGGEFSAGPVKLLSGLCPKPHILAMHFFAVAFFGIIKTVFPFPTPYRIKTAYQILCAASDIVVPLLANEKSLRYLTILCRVLRLTNQ